MLKENRMFGIMPLPEYVYVPTDCDISKPNVSCVEIGDYVQVGQPVVECQDEIALITHSSVAGKVTDIIADENTSVVNGKLIVIKPEGEQTLWEGIKPPEIKTRKEFLKAIGDSGLIGLEGTSLDTCLAMTDEQLDNLDTLIVNCVEWTELSDIENTLIRGDAESIVDGIYLTMEMLELEHCYIAVEENREDIIIALKPFIRQEDKEKIQIVPMPYPCPPGADRMLIHSTVGELLSDSALPQDLGIHISNVASFAAISYFNKYGSPVIYKLISVGGTAMSDVKEIAVPIGALISDVIEYCAGSCDVASVILLGGNEQEGAINSKKTPISMRNNTILVYDQLTFEKAFECAREECNKCVDSCPRGINPKEVFQAFRAEDIKELRALGMEECNECARCTFVCPGGQTLRHVISSARKIVAY